VTRPAKRAKSFLVDAAHMRRIAPRRPRTGVARLVRNTVDARAASDRAWLLACVGRVAFGDGGGPLYITPLHSFRVKPANIRPGSDEDFADRGGAILASVRGTAPSPRWRRHPRPRHHDPKMGFQSFLRQMAARRAEFESARLGGVVAAETAQ